MFCYTEIIMEFFLTHKSMKLRLKKRQLGHFNISQPAVAHFPLSVFQCFLQYRLTQARTIVFLLLTSAELHPEKPVNVHLYWFVTCFSFLTPANDSHLPTCFSTSNLNLMLTNKRLMGKVTLKSQDASSPWRKMENLAHGLHLKVDMEYFICLHTL